MPEADSSIVVQLRKDFELSIVELTSDGKIILDREFTQDVELDETQVRVLGNLMLNAGYLLSPDELLMP